MAGQEPGQTITPQPSEQPAKTSTPPTNPVSPSVNPVVNASPDVIGEPTPQWQFKSDVSSASTPTTNSNGSGVQFNNTQPVTWSASEFIAHKKSVSWFFLLAIAAVAVATLVLFLTHDKISTAVIIIAAIFLGFFAARKPRTLSYTLDEAGLSIGEKFYGYELFKSFSILDEGAFSSIVLAPLKRFMPDLSLYYDPKDEQKITDILAVRLPFEDHKSDIVDGFMRRIRF